MPTPPKRDHRITLDQGIDFTKRFGAANPKAEKAAMFWSDGGLAELMGQKGYAGLRIYNGLDDKGAPAPVLVAVDAQGNDMTGGTILEMHLPCPVFCDASSALMSR